MTLNNVWIDCVGCARTHQHCKAWRKYKRRCVTVEAKKILCMSKDVSEVDVHEMSGLGKHNVVIMAIFDSQKVRGNAVARTRANEVLDCLSIGPCLSTPRQVIS